MAKPPVLYYFTLVMTSVYFLAGLFVVFSPMMARLLPGWKHIVLGLMLILYGFIRMRRLKSIRKSMEEGA